MTGRMKFLETFASQIRTLKDSEPLDAFAGVFMDPPGNCAFAGTSLTE